MEVLEIASWHYHQTIGYEPIESNVRNYFNQIYFQADQIVSNGFNANDWLNGLFKCVNCPAIDFPTKCRYVDPLKLIIEILDQPPSNNQQINRLNLVNNINNRKPILDVTLQDESNTEDASDIVCYVQLNQSNSIRMGPKFSYGQENEKSDINKKLEMTKLC